MSPTRTYRTHPVSNARARRVTAFVIAGLTLAGTASSTFAAPGGEPADTPPTTVADPDAQPDDSPETTTPSTTSTTVAPDDPDTSTTATTPEQPDTDPASGTDTGEDNGTATDNEGDADPDATATTTTTVPVPAAQNIKVYPEEIGNILATIRYMESRGQYEIPPNKGNASGAYQFIASTWRNYGDYPHAYLAPPHVQDERAAKDVELFLKQWNNDVSMIPVMWYYPRAAREPALMDIVPLPSAGNVLTIREYQQRWLGTFATISGNPVPQAVGFAESLSRLALPPEPPARDDGIPSIEFPVLGPSNIASPDCNGDADDASATAALTDVEAAGLCTEQAPSIVFGVKLQPIRAVADGVVTHVDDQPSSGRPITVTITDVTGRSYTYSGFNDDNPGTDDGDAPAHLRLTEAARVGRTVWAGQIIGFMGDTDPLPIGVRAEVPTDSSVTIDPDAVAPHIRLSITDLDGSPIDAYGPVIDSLFRSGCQIGIGRWSVPARSSRHDTVVVETTDDDDDIDSEWVINSKGQVTASGWAALIMPGSPCTWSPTQAYGPGGAGASSVPDRWDDGLDLPTSIWVELAIANTETTTNPLLRL